jgi:hypothetical protein
MLVCVVCGVKCNVPSIFQAKTAPWVVVVRVLLIVFAKKKILTIFFKTFSVIISLQSRCLGRSGPTNPNKRPLWRFGGRRPNGVVRPWQKKKKTQLVDNSRN